MIQGINANCQHCKAVFHEEDITEDDKRDLTAEEIRDWMVGYSWYCMKLPDERGKQLFEHMDDDCPCPMAYKVDTTKAIAIRPPVITLFLEREEYAQSLLDHTPEDASPGEESRDTTAEGRRPQADSTTEGASSSRPSG